MSENYNDMGIKLADRHMEQWLNNLLWNHKLEVKLEKTHYVRHLEKEFRKLVWYLCIELSADKYGVPGIACRLIERFLTYTTREHTSLRRGTAAYANVVKKVADEFLLMASVAIILSAKWCSSQLHITYETLSVRLKKYNFTYDNHKIFQMEFTIYKAFDFQLPLSSSEEIAQTLAIAVEILSDINETVALIADIAEYNRDTISKELQSVANIVYPHENKTMLATLHLGAAVTVAVAQYLEVSENNLLTKICKIVRAPESYIKCISDSILKNIDN